MTPVTKIAGSTFHIVYGGFNTNCIIYRVVSSHNVVCRGGGALSVLGIRPVRRPVNVRVFNNAGRALIRTTGFVSRGARTSMVSVGVNYPIGGIIGASTKTG